MSVQWKKRHTWLVWLRRLLHLVVNWLCYQLYCNIGTNCRYTPDHGRRFEAQFCQQHSNHSQCMPSPNYSSQIWTKPLPRSFSVCPHTHNMPIKQRINYKLCTNVHRCLHGRTPSYLIELITPSAAAHTPAGLRSVELGTVAVPDAYSSFGDARAFAVAAPRAWNNLPRSHFARPSLLTASRETWRRSYITLLSFLNISVTVFWLLSC